MKVKNFCIAVLFFTTNFIVYGQGSFKPGYVVTHKNDTIAGYIKISSNQVNSDKCQFKRDLESEVIEYLPQELISYKIENDKYYVSKEIEFEGAKERFFLEYLINGVADLYYKRDINGEYFYIEKGDVLTVLQNEKIYSSDEDQNTQFVRTSNQYKKVMSYIFQDAPDLRGQIAKAPFEYKSLLKLTKNYHNSVCDEYKCIDYTKSTHAGRYIEAVVGYRMSTFGFKEIEETSTNNGLVIGANIRFEPFKSRNNLNFLIGVNYSKEEYNHSILRYKKVDVNYSALNIPLSMEFFFLANKKIRPFLYGYLSPNFLIYSPVWSVKRGAYEPENIRKMFLAVSTGAGLLVMLTENSYLIGRVGYEYKFPIRQDNYLLDKIRIKSFIYSIGYGVNINRKKS